MGVCRAGFRCASVVSVTACEQAHFFGVSREYLGGKAAICEPEAISVLTSLMLRRWTFSQLSFPGLWERTFVWCWPCHLWDPDFRSVVVIFPRLLTQYRSFSCHTGPRKHWWRMPITYSTVCVALFLFCCFQFYSNKNKIQVSKQKETKNRKLEELLYWASSLQL